MDPPRCNYSLTLGGEATVKSHEEGFILDATAILFDELAVIHRHAQLKYRTRNLR